MYNWKDSIKKKPEIGDSILAKTLSGQVFYAVYSNENEFDVHRLDQNRDYRKAWYKYSSRTVVQWRYFKTT